MTRPETIQLTLDGAKEQLINLLPTMSKYFELGGRASFSTPEKPFPAFHLKEDIEFLGFSLSARDTYAFDNKLQLYRSAVVGTGIDENGNEIYQFAAQAVEEENHNITFAHIIRHVLHHNATYFNASTTTAWEALLKDNFWDDPESIINLLLSLPISKTVQTEALRSILPQRGIKPNNKLANEMTRDFVNCGEIALRVSKIGARNEITTRALLSYASENVSLSGRAKYTPYDREVHDGVVTLCVAGNEIVTPEMVYRAMNGMTETEFVSPQSIGAVTRSLDKHDQTVIEIDFTQEAQAYNKDYSNANYKGRLLSFERISVTAGGHTKIGYRLLRRPILYEYAQVSGQIINVPIALLQTKGAVRSTDEIIVIRGYLLRQIEGMKSRSFNRSSKITFEGIYTELDISTDNLNEMAYKNKTRTIRQHVDAILTEWVKQGYIKEHNTYKEGKTIKGIAIELIEKP